MFATPANRSRELSRRLYNRRWRNQRSLRRRPPCKKTELSSAFHRFRSVAPDRNRCDSDFRLKEINPSEYTDRIGSDEQFAALRRLLTNESYDEPTLCKRYGIEKISDFEDVPDREQAEPWDRDAVGMLFRLFIESRFIPETTVREKLGSDNLELLYTLGLVHGNEANAEEVWAPVSLVPYAGVWSVCDSWHRPDRAVLSPRDPVYAPIVSNAHRFFQLMPKMPCERLLELCSGTAFATLHAARLCWPFVRLRHLASQHGFCGV